ncbi:putative structural maintenance of chromosomes protein [Helianthus anomalus]
MPHYRGIIFLNHYGWSYQWVQSHKHEFKKEVYGPLLIEVTSCCVLNFQYGYVFIICFLKLIFNRALGQHFNPTFQPNFMLHTSYLESHVPYYIWKAFIKQDFANRDLLFRNLKSFDVAVINQMSSMGLYSRLDQVFDAPHAIKEVLIGQAGLEH